MKKTFLFLLLGACVSLSQAQVTFTETSFPTTGNDKAVVDMNGDHLDDVVAVNSTNVNIFYQQAGGGFEEVNITTTPADYPASWSLAAADYDKNGFTDLLYGAGSGVTFMRANNTGDGFTEVSGPEDIFSQRSNFVDINNDGHLDAFVCHDVAPNVYYINDGNGNLSYVQGGLGDFSSGGNYGSVWIDYDNDRDIDLFIAKCGGSLARRTNQMHTNQGDGTYIENALDIGLADPMQTWSSAWADYDNDGDMDVFVGASSGTHKLMRNDGDGTFTDVTVASGVLAFTDTGIENCTYDMDNDGNLDILASGSILYGNGDLTFTNIVQNVFPGNGSLGDLNNDGFIDHVVFEELHTNNGNSNNWITINTVGTQSNIDGIGARVEVATASGTRIRDVRSGEGFGFMSTLNTHVGLGTDAAIESITIYWPSGIIDVIDNPDVNASIVIVEGETLGLDESFVENLILYPNPTEDILRLNNQIELNEATYSIFTMEGKLVNNQRLNGGSIDVNGLTSGNYIVIITNNGTSLAQRFIKK